MSIFKTKFKIFSIIVIFTLGFISCEEEAPTEVYDNDPGAPAPKINSIEPTDSVFSYVTGIRITGENFSSLTDSINGNKVYFNGEPGSVISASSTEIVVLSPDISGDSIRIKVIAPPAAPIAEYYPYKIFATVDKIEQFNPLESVTAIELDNEGNLYGFVTESLAGKIYKVTPDGVKTEYGTAPFPSASDMKFGPGGYLYVQQSNNEKIHRIAPDGGAATVFVTLPNTADNMRFYDFDENQNLFAAGTRTGIFVINHQSGSARRVNDDYRNHDVKSVRVYNGYVYVTATYNGANTSFPAEGIWRSQITSAAGDLGTPEVVFDFAIAGVEAASLVSIPLTFSSTGEIFVGTDQENSILIIHSDGNYESLYPNFIDPTSLQIVWGNGKFIYQNRSDKGGVYKIYADRLGAPYYGRQ
ncbi:MAG: IPT/TIG domain-containing protein [Ignavibacteria bacterium]|nr:IPT/TIG domain-containing protein [Ignavibacteria bacterium]